MAHNAQPLVEILSFAGCPGREPAVELVRRVARELEVTADVRIIDVDDPETAERLRFLGSPTIRVGGHDVEPGSEERREYAISCRVYDTPEGRRGLPDEALVRDALSAAA